jgi:uncharacterized membrane protein
MKFSPKMMWGCVAVLGLVIIAAAAGFGIGAFFAVPCLLMMGAMMWMMFGIGRGNSAPRSSAPSDRPSPTNSPVDILERRFAQGELSPEEYRARRDVLLDGSEAPARGSEDKPLTLSGVGEGRQ